MSELTDEERALEKAWQEEGDGQTIPWTFASGWAARGQYDAAAIEVERAKVTQLETRLGELMERLGHAEAEEAKVGRLREALRRHATHALSCPAFEEEFAAAFRGERGNDQACTCGLSAVLFE